MQIFLKFLSRSPHAKAQISKAKNNGWSAPEDDKTLIGAVFARYQYELKKLNAVDFDDLLLLAVKLLNEHEDVCEKWRSRFSHIMVDEFQDTNRLQLNLVSLLANSSQNVAVVGDDDQSIYGWRGAEVANILEFEAHFPNPTIVTLEQNYRSTNAILNLANSVIKNNPRRRAKKLWSAHAEGERSRLIQAKDDREEAQFVVDEIQKLNFANGEKWESFAVLYRMNAQSRAIEENLRRLKIPYRLVGGKSWFDKREVKDVLAYLTCLLNPDDDANLLRIINTPARGISDVTVERAREYSIEKQSSVFAALQDAEFLSSLTAKARESIGAFFDLIDRYETRMHEPLTNFSHALTELLEEVKYKEDLKRTCKTPQEALNRESAVNDIVNALERYQQRSQEGLRGFIDEMMLNRDKDEEKDEKGSGVTLITLHAAKGLEFPNVYLIGLEEGVLPHDRSKVEGTVDEERRLLYVGITRAMRSLTMSFCLNRLRYGSAMPCTPSSFIKEFDETLIERKNLTEMLNAPVSEVSAKNAFAMMRARIGS